MLTQRVSAKWRQYLMSAPAFFFPPLTRSGQPVPCRKRCLLLLLILPGRFTERLGGFFDIENVIDNLERQPDVLPIAREGRIQIILRARVNGAEPQARAQQRTGLGTMNGIE